MCSVHRMAVYSRGFRLVASAFRRKIPYAKGTLMRIAAALLLFLILATATATTARQQTATPQTTPATAPPATASSPGVPSCPELATAMTALVRNDARVRDWAQLARYRDANRSVTAPAAG